ncbi:MAG: hypothetical protein ACQERS_11205 [Bacteroidota bacterium]
MKSRVFFFILMLIITGSCEDFFEKDLSALELVLLSPPDNYISRNSEIILWWDYLNGAYDYQLQIVYPDFVSPEKLVIDTIIIENKLEVKLDTGIYQWRVRGMNGSSETSYSLRNIRIIEAMD